ncbi:MAG: phosphate transport system substrate-binding protein [Planctomycetota bacterium]
MTTPKLPIGPLIAGLCAALASCSSPTHHAPPSTQRYLGSSTVAVFLRDAASAYDGVQLSFDTQPESDGGEQAILAGTTDLAGIAREPGAAILGSGVVASLIGRDAIAVVVNAKNPTLELGSEDLRRIFTGQIENWSQLGGPDLPLHAYVVAPESATYGLFQAKVLGGEPYTGCATVRPDTALLDQVAADPGGIGAISFSFLPKASDLRALAIDGAQPDVTNFDYPISRPLYLLWRRGDPALANFVKWTLSAPGQALLMRHFVGRRVLGSVGSQEAQPSMGSLVVVTPTYPFYDGGLYYYPHEPYSLHRRDGSFLRSITNHRGENDESPMRILLMPGTYLVRVRPESGDSLEYYVTIESDATTVLDVVALDQGRAR